MKISPFIDPEGIPRDRERAAYRPVLISERGRFSIGFLPPDGDGLTCLEFVQIFAIPLRPGISAEAARALVDNLRQAAAGLDAVYRPNPDLPEPPTYPNIVALRAA